MKERDYLYIRNQRTWRYDNFGKLIRWIPRTVLFRRGIAKDESYSLLNKYLWKSMPPAQYPQGYFLPSKYYC